MIPPIKNIVLSLFLLLTYSTLLGQTCCSAGVPFNSFLGISGEQAKTINVQIGYTYNSINLLVDNDSRIENDPRSRYGQIFTGKIDYTISNKWAASFVLPFIHHSRNTVSENQSSFGFADPIAIIQFNVLQNTFNKLTVSGGIKLPLGQSNHKSNNGIFLSPDMQSGTGSVDYLLRLNYTRSNFILPFLHLYSTNVLRLNGKNKTFGSTTNFAGREFGFGNEVTFELGFQYLLVTKNAFLFPGIGLQLRSSQANIENGVDAPNSGGRWLNIPIGISYTNNGSKSIVVKAEIPVAQQLNGLQISTNFNFGIQFYYPFSINNSTQQS